jgi:thioredoxin reductase (NADPH)
VRDVNTGVVTELPVTGLFVAIGTSRAASCSPANWRSIPPGIVVDHPTTRTSVSGVFACGDVVDHVYRQAVTAAGTGSAAALDVERYLAALDQEPTLVPASTTG